jgi:hypothetical protein
MKTNRAMRAALLAVGNGDGYVCGVDLYNFFDNTLQV